MKINLINIFKGWYNAWRKLPPGIKRFYDDRLNVCYTNECGKLKLGICTACGCPVKKKTKVLSEKCPENLWFPWVYEIEGAMFIRLSEVPEWMAKEWNRLEEAYIQDERLPYDAILLEDWEYFLQEAETAIESH